MATELKTNIYHKSILRLCILHFVVYSLIAMVLVWSTDFYIRSYVQFQFPNIHTITQNKAALKNEKYDKLIRKDLPGCAFFILDENGAIQFQHIDSASPVYEKLSGNPSPSAFSVSTILNEEFLVAHAQRHSKFSYTTKNNEQRILIFIAPNVSVEQYEQTVQNVSSVWFTTALFLFGILLFQANRLWNAIQKCITPLDTAISSIESNHDIEISEEQVPVELKPIVVHFKNLSAQLRLAQQEKKEEENKRYRMIANISHDLKSPLTSIQGFSKAFLDHIIPEESFEKYMQLIHQKALLSSSLTRSLFDYANMEHPNFRLDLKSTDIVELSRTFINERYIEFELRNFKLHIDFPDQPIYVKIDVSLIRRAFYNLSENCLTHTPDGTDVFCKIYDDANAVHIITADNGIGIDENIRENIFENHVIGENPSLAIHRSGLGMPIVKSIIELHHGEIHLVSKKDSPFKTEFNILLPKA